MAGRNHPEEEAPKPWDSGRKGYREEHEPLDEHPVIARSQSWVDETERLTYEITAESWPRLPGESPLQYMRRLAEKAGAKLATRPDKPMPRLGATQRWMEMLHKQVCELAKGEK